MGLAEWMKDDKERSGSTCRLVRISIRKRNGGGHGWTCGAKMANDDVVERGNLWNLWRLVLIIEVNDGKRK